MKGRGGEIKNIDFENITLESASRVAIKVSFRYSSEPLDDQSAPVTDVPDMSNISVENFVCGSAKLGLLIEGLDGYPIRNLYFDNVRIGTSDAARIYDVEGLTMRDVKLEPTE